MLIREQWQTFGADEAPADVHMRVVPVPLLGTEVVGADEGRVGDHFTSRSRTQVTHVVRHGAAQATHQLPCNSKMEVYSRLDRFTTLGFCTQK